MPFPMAAARGKMIQAPPWTLDDSLVAYWRLNETTMQRNDSCGFSPLGLTADNVISAAGKVGNAGAFVNAEGDALIAYASDYLVTGDIDFTIAAWVYLSAKPGNMDVLSKWNGVTSDFEFILGYGLTADRLRFLVRDFADTKSTTQLADTLGSPQINTWYFVVAWHDSVNNTINIQVNNGTIDSTAYTDGVHESTTHLFVGGRIETPTSTWSGRIDEVGIWKRVLSAGEKTVLYNGGNGRGYPGAQEFFGVLGQWSLFTNPRAIYSSGVYYWSTVDTLGNIWAYSFKPSNGTRTSVILAAALEIDDHDHASVLLRDSDSKILAFYTKHNDTNNARLRISSAANDASAFAAEVNLDAQLGGNIYSYLCPIQLTGEANDPIYLFWRDRLGDSTFDGHYFSTSADGGATWAARTQFFVNGTERPYFQYARNGTTRIDFTCTQGHPNEVAGCSIYHFYYQGGHWYKSDGTDLGDSAAALPLAPADVTQVYDGSSVEAWCWDIAINSNGYPVIVYATFPTPASDHRYRYARWTGSTWDDHEICTAGGPLYAVEAYYSGGVTLDKTNPSIAWCSRYTGSQWEIWKYTTSDGGTTWTGTQITASSAYMNARPYCAVGAPENATAFWWHGRYTSYSNFHTTLRLAL